MLLSGLLKSSDWQQSVLESTYELILLHMLLSLPLLLLVVLQILLLSRLTALALLVVYACYLVFQLGTHHNLFSGEPGACIRTPGHNPHSQLLLQLLCICVVSTLLCVEAGQAADKRSPHYLQRRPAASGTRVSARHCQLLMQLVMCACQPKKLVWWLSIKPTISLQMLMIQVLRILAVALFTLPGEGDDDGDEPLMTLTAAALWLGGITVLVAFLSEFLTGSIEEVGGILWSPCWCCLRKSAGMAVHMTACRLSPDSRMPAACASGECTSCGICHHLGWAWLSPVLSLLYHLMTGGFG